MKIRIFYESLGIDSEMDKRFKKALPEFEFVGSGYDFIKRERDLEFDSRRSDKSIMIATCEVASK